VLRHDKCEGLSVPAVLPLSHLTSPSVIESANAGVFTTLISPSPATRDDKIQVLCQQRYSKSAKYPVLLRNCMESIVLCTTMFYLTLLNWHLNVSATYWLKFNGRCNYDENYLNKITIFSFNHTNMFTHISKS